MNKEELRKKLDLEGIRPDVYWLEGGLPSETFCLCEIEGKWQVYYSERGKKTGLREFETEGDACQYFYEEIISTKGVRFPKN